ncbi:MAG: tetratricopeptide repeat protein [Nitrospinae bacterium]|nr:tetratricopeptide repeat protein [Nitrospinota bacterium]
MNYTKLAIGRLTALAVVLLIPSACETVSKKEWAITQNQVTRIDERVATIGKTLSLQADLAANIEQLRSSVSVMTGQIEEFNARTQMFSERLAKQEKNLNETLAANRNDIIESYSGLAQETREFRKEIQAMSLEARGSARAIDVRIASVEARLAVMDEAIHNQPSKKTGKAREKEKTVAEPIRPEATPVAQPDQKSEWGLYENSYTSFIRGDYETAARGFLEHLGLYPDSSLSDDALFWLGESFLGMNNNLKAVEAFGAVWDRFPSSVKAGPALLQMAESLIRLGRMDEAVLKLKVIVEKLPGSPEAEKASRMISALAPGTPERR